MWLENGRNKLMSLRRFFQQAYFYHKGRRAAFSAEEFALFQIGYPLITLIFYCLIATYSFQTESLGRWVIGNAFLLCTNSCVFGLGTIFMGERYNGRLRSIIASPCGKLSLILANGLFPAVTAIISSLLGMIVGSLIFKVDFSGINLCKVFAAIICAMISASCFGLLLAVFGMISDNMHLILNSVSGLLMIFTGAEFPIENLPKQVQFVSWLFPLTKSIKAMNNLLEGSEDYFIPLLITEVLTGLSYLVLARLILAGAERAARSKGSLDMY